jgi:hypothetical protein
LIRHPGFGVGEGSFLSFRGGLRIGLSRGGVRPLPVPSPPGTGFHPTTGCAVWNIFACRLAPDRRGLARGSPTDKPGEDEALPQSHDPSFTPLRPDSAWIRQGLQVFRTQKWPRSMRPKQREKNRALVYGVFLVSRGVEAARGEGGVSLRATWREAFVTARVAAGGNRGHFQPWTSFGRTKERMGRKNILHSRCSWAGMERGGGRNPSAATLRHHQAVRPGARRVAPSGAWNAPEGKSPQERKPGKACAGKGVGEKQRSFM